MMGQRLSGLFILGRSSLSPLGPRGRRTPFAAQAQVFVAEAGRIKLRGPSVHTTGEVVRGTVVASTWETLSGASLEQHHSSWILVAPATGRILLGLSLDEFTLETAGGGLYGVSLGWLSGNLLPHLGNTVTNAGRWAVRRGSGALADLRATGKLRATLTWAELGPQRCTYVGPVTIRGWLWGPGLNQGEGREEIRSRKEAGI